MLDFTPVKQKRYDLMLCGAGKMLGEEELFSGHRRRYYATIESECVVYEIEFERMLNVCHENHFVRQILKQKIIDKKSIINSIRNHKSRVETVREAYDKELKQASIKKAMQIKNLGSNADLKT